VKPEAVGLYQNKGPSTVEESMGPILVKLVAKGSNLDLCLTLFTLLALPIKARILC
jgi:hypothetical protein